MPGCEASAIRDQDPPGATRRRDEQGNVGAPSVSAECSDEISQVSDGAVSHLQDNFAPSQAGEVGWAVAAHRRDDQADAYGQAVESGHLRRHRGHGQAQEPIPVARLVDWILGCHDRPKRDFLGAS